MTGIRIEDIWSPVVQSLLRMVAGAMLLQHGLASLPILDGRLPPMPGLWASGTVALIGGALLLVGLLTRPVALVCCAYAIATYLALHAPRSLSPMHNGGEFAALYSVVFLYLTFAGAGPWSLDARSAPVRLPAAPARDSRHRDSRHRASDKPGTPDPISPSAWRTTFGRARPGAR